MRHASRRDVLFLCVANSARSQMAEGVGRALAPAGIGVHSAGSAPSTLNPLAVRVMAEIGIDIGAHYSKSVDDLPLHLIGTVVTLCAEEVCPVFAGEVRRLHWPLPDPAAVAGDEEARLGAFREVRDAIRERVSRLFATDLSAPEQDSEDHETTIEGERETDQATIRGVWRWRPR